MWLQCYKCSSSPDHGFQRMSLEHSTVRQNDISQKPQLMEQALIALQQYHNNLFFWIVIKTSFFLAQQCSLDHLTKKSNWQRLISLSRNTLISHHIYAITPAQGHKHTFIIILHLYN